MIATVNKQNDVVVVEFEGSLDVSLQQKLKDKLDDCVRDHGRDMVLDFNSVSFIDSSCLGVLVSCARRLREKKGDIKLSRLSDDVRSIFQITRLDKIFEIHETKEQAVDSYYK